MKRIDESQRDSTSIEMVERAKMFDPGRGRIIGRFVIHGRFIENRHLVYPVKSGNLAILYCEDNQCLKIYKRFNPVKISKSL